MRLLLGSPFLLTATQQRKVMILPFPPSFSEAGCLPLPPGDLLGSRRPKLWVKDEKC